MEAHILKLTTSETFLTSTSTLKINNLESTISEIKILASNPDSVNVGDVRVARSDKMSLLAMECEDFSIVVFQLKPSAPNLTEMDFDFNIPTFLEIIKKIFAVSRKFTKIEDFIFVSNYFLQFPMKSLEDCVKFLIMESYEEDVSNLELKRREEEAIHNYNNYSHSANTRNAESGDVEASNAINTGIKPNVAKIISALTVKENLKMTSQNMENVKKNNLEMTGKLSLFISDSDKETFKNGINYDIGNPEDLKISYSPYLDDENLQMNILRSKNKEFLTSKNIPIAKYSKSFENKIIELNCSILEEENWDSEESSSSNEIMKVLNLEIKLSEEKFAKENLKNFQIEFSDKILGKNIKKVSEKFVYNVSEFDEFEDNNIVISGKINELESLFPMKIKIESSNGCFLGVSSDDIKVFEKFAVELVVENY